MCLVSRVSGRCSPLMDTNRSGIQRSTQRVFPQLGDIAIFCILYVLAVSMNNVLAARSARYDKGQREAA
jgi:hypothetical protein